MSLNSDLHTHLQTVAAITALVGTRIYRVNATQNAARPYIVFSRISEPGDYDHGGKTNWREARYQFDIVGDTVDSVTSVREALETALDAHSGTWGSRVIYLVTKDTDNDVHLEDTNRRQNSIDFLIQHDAS